MKMTYVDAITKYNALAEIEKGKKEDQPWDLPPEAYVLITTMMNALRPYVEGYQKGRTARFKRATKGNVRRDQFEQVTFVNPADEMAFRAREDKILGSEINILMPVSKLDLKIKENATMPPTLLVRLDGLYNLPHDKIFDFKMEDGTASPIPVEPDDDDEPKAPVIQLRKDIAAE